MKYEPMNKQMSHEFPILYICVSNVFVMVILMFEMYELWMNKFCTISIIKLWDVKFVMFVLSFNTNQSFETLLEADPNLFAKFYNLIVPLTNEDFNIDPSGVFRNSPII